jgi:hypothetical protein
MITFALTAGECAPYRRTASLSSTAAGCGIVRINPVGNLAGFETSHAMGF